MLNHFIQRYIKEEQLDVPCYTLVTDPFPPFWRGWASPYVDGYFVASDEAEGRGFLAPEEARQTLWVKRVPFFYEAALADATGGAGHPPEPRSSAPEASGFR